MSWTVVKEGYRYKRDDGALVRYDERSPYPNPAKESARMFTAWSPDPEDKYLERRSKRGLSWPRRWKNPAAAMKAVDKLYPERKP